MRHDFPAALQRYLVSRRAVQLEAGAAEVAISCFSPERHTNGDHNPSLRVDLAGGVWRCDVCGVGGGAIELVMGYERIGKDEAQRLLLGDPPPAPTPSRMTRRRPAGSGSGGRTPKLSPEDLRERMRRYRAALDTPEGAEILAWLELHWRASRAVLDRYVVGLAPLDPWAPASWKHPPGAPIRTWALACPSTGADLVLSGIKLYRPRWKELGGSDEGKAHAERGSSPGLFGGHFLRENAAAERTLVLVGGEKDALVTVAAFPDAIVVANARGEGGWTGATGAELAAAIARAAPAHVVVDLDANEVDRGTLHAAEAFAGAHGFAFERDANGNRKKDQDSSQRGSP